MTPNLGSAHRWLRVLAALAMASLAVMAPLPLIPRVLGFGGLALYMVVTALTGHCAGMRLLGRTECPR